MPAAPLLEPLLATPSLRYERALKAGIEVLGVAQGTMLDWTAAP